MWPVELTETFEPTLCGRLPAASRTRVAVRVRFAIPPCDTKEKACRSFGIAPANGRWNVVLFRLS